MKGAGVNRKKGEARVVYGPKTVAVEYWFKRGVKAGFNVTSGQ